MSERGQTRPADIAVHIERPIKLRRVLGIPGLFSAAYGNVGSSIYYALGVVAMSALGLTPVVLAFSGILFLFTALTYAEGATMLPEAGGSGAFARRAFNDLVSFGSSWVLMLDYLVTIAISAFSAANYLGHFLPILGESPYNMITAIVIIGLFTAINITGIKESARLNVVLVIFGILTQVAIAVVGVMLVINIPRLIENIHWGVAPTMGQLLFGLSISMIGYTGIETVANLGAETRQPGKKIPRTVILVFGTVFLLYIFMSMTALSAYPVYQIGNHWVTDLSERFLNDPITGITYVFPEVIRNISGHIVALLAFAILLIATNAGVIGASRLAYFMGLRQQLPSIVSSISTHTRVPLTSLIIIGVLACALVLVGQVTIMADLYAFGAMLAYTMAHVSVIALRIKEPDLPRPFKMPWNITIAGKQIPIMSILGGLATAGTWLIVVWTHEYGRIVGFAWLGVGLLIFVLYRYFTKRPILGKIEIKTRVKIRR